MTQLRIIVCVNMVSSLNLTVTFVFLWSYFHRTRIHLNRNHFLGTKANSTDPDQKPQQDFILKFEQKARHHENKPV